MATITSVGSGAWSVAGTWDAGVPVDGDDVVIASGHTVTFDVDQSTFTTGVKITITGTLTHTTASGTFYMFLKTGGAILGSGTWNIGTSGTPIPFASKHTITGASGFQITPGAGFTMNVYGTEPANKFAVISGSEAVGQTELSVSTDVTSDLWTDGDNVIVSETVAFDRQLHTIAAGGIAAGAITVTAGLSDAKDSGAYIVLLNRNVQIIGVGANLIALGNNAVTLNIGSGLITRSGSTNHYLIQASALAATINISGGVFYSPSFHYMSGVAVTISDGVFVGCSNNVSDSRALVISDGLFIGNDGINATAYISGGSFLGNSKCFKNSVYISGGTFSNANYLLSGLVDGIISNVTVVGKFAEYSCFTARNVLMTGSEFSSHANMRSYAESLDHNQVVGAYKAAAPLGGGNIVSQTSVLPDGYSLAYLLTPASAIMPCYLKYSFTVVKGQAATIEVQLRKDASMAFLPRVILTKYGEDALSGGTSPVDSFVMTDSVDTWESDTFTIDNSAGATDLDYTLWFIAKNASGNVYSAYDITTQGGTGGGSVKILPYSGKVGLA